MKKASDDLEAALGHRFQDRALLAQALTPPSSGLHPHNQRLEFLGDALLNAAVALLIHRQKPDWAEGAMSKLRGTLVCTEALEAWGRDLNLVLRSGPRSPRRAAGPKALADGVEALLAAVHEDAGASGFEAVLRLCEARFLRAVQAARPDDWKLRDAKTALQERAAALGLPPPNYRLQARSGPDHAPRVSIVVEAGEHRAAGDGTSLKAAEAAAARSLLGLIGE